ncbi:hypothetical protein F383_03964 [Gossypium arboreum]|uniref:Uncharacterized protein n=1 Tax=Gossypium arboreum TaxID=29729 RepID=A0A0B0PPN4_GOSAR|nr:hypothetical protein F383_03964 [Gossypium arboreum]
MSIWKVRARPEVVTQGRVTWGCPYRAQVEFNSKKANFEGF